MRIGYLHFLLLGFFTLISPDPLLMIFAGFTLFFVMRIMWRENEPKHLLVNMVLYWLVIGILLPFGALSQKPLEAFSRYGGANMIPTATLLGVIALLVIVMGIHWPIRKIHVYNADVLLNILKRVY